MKEKDKKIGWGLKRKRKLKIGRKFYNEMES